ncbi:hypothetical protein K461DRAFT_289010 [Myriangium duriaei CBS 260.36]|uniref:ATPase expression protein 2, mitochondrial n=1 Tax=Myriangium duriaei CBS 260.36 TaxID=1168546 RepID=A0A9P4J829_9PEZI|nr:hypothetical protein K461DRAFT_289010 [Myriangium duriaei CBS 260.36]
MKRRTSPLRAEKKNQSTTHRREASESLFRPRAQWPVTRRKSGVPSADIRRHRETLRGWRNVSTAATLDDLHELFEDDEASSPSRSGSSPPASPEWAKILQQIQSALRQRASDALSKAITPTMVQSGSLAFIEDNTFEDILGLWCSGDYFGDLITQHQLVNEKAAKDMRLTPINQIVEEYISMLTNIAYFRRKSGRRMSTEQYRHLLCAAHSTGSSAIAEFFWQWMNEDRAVPDIDCYAHYLGAHVWNDLLTGYRKKAHVTPQNIMARERRTQGKPYDSYKVREGGIKQFVTRVFQKLVDSGNSANEELICHVMVGLAREGDLKGMQKLMSRTWGINVSNVLADDDSPPSKTLTSDSDLYPTDRLLTTVAFCYAINSDLPKALRIIDYISRHYALTPPIGVWDLLLTWGYNLSRKQPAKSDWQAVLDCDAVYQIWETMQDAPYEISPTLPMYDTLIRTLCGTSRAGEMFAAMEAGLAYRNQTASKQAVREAENAVEELAQSRVRGPRAMERAQRTLEEAHLSAERGARYLKMWAQMFLNHTHDVARRIDLPEADEMCYVHVPQLLQGKWKGFVRRKVEYYTPTGFVEIELADEEQILERHERLREERARTKAVLDLNPRAMGHEWVVKEWQTRRAAAMET